MDKASLPLNILLVSRLSHLSREGSPHQGAEGWDVIWIIWFKNEMRMGELCCQSDAEGRQQCAEVNCSPVHGITKEIYPPSSA